MVKTFIRAIALGCALLATPILAQQVQVSSATKTFDNNTVAPQQGDLSGNLRVTVQGSATGTSAPQVQGTTAHDGVAVDNPVSMGGIAMASGTVRPAVSAAGDEVRLALTLNGATVISGGVVNSVGGWEGDASAQQMQSDNGSFYKLAVVPYNWTGAATSAQRGDANGTVVQPAISSTFWQYASPTVGIVSSTADVAIKTAAGAGVRNYVCAIDLGHDLLSAVTEIVVKDGATVLWRGKLQTPAVDSSGTAGRTFTPCLRGTANTAVNVALLSVVTGGVFVNTQGYTGQ